MHKSIEFEYCLWPLQLSTTKEIISIDYRNGKERMSKNKL